MSYPVHREREHLDRSEWSLVFEDDFGSGALDRDKWVAHYLPQWTTPDRSASHYHFDEGSLRLRIDADQPAWREEDGELRVSNIQTGTFSGPLGSDRGASRHRPDLRVRTPVPTRRLYTPSSGLVEARLRAARDPSCMLALWLVGLEETSQDQAGEICIAELYGDALGPSRATVKMGIKAHHDPHLTDDMKDVELDIDATDWHTYAAAWTPQGTSFYVDDELVRLVPQGLAYPVQIMVSLFEFPGSRRRPTDYPKTGDVAAVRGYEPVEGRVVEPQASTNTVREGMAPR